MLKAIVFGTLLFIISSLAPADLIVTTYKDGDITYVKILPSYYTGNGVAKDGKVTCLVVSGTQIMDAGSSSKDCLNPAKNHKLTNFKKNVKFTLNGQEVTGPLVVLPHEANNANQGIGNYEAEKAVAHIDEKGNLVLVEQAMQLPVDDKGRVTGGLTSSSKVYVQPLTSKVNGALSLATVREGGEQIFPGYVSGAPTTVQTTVTAAPVKASAPEVKDPIADPPAAPAVIAPVVPTKEEKDAAMGSTTLSVEDTTIDCGVKKGSDEFCSNLQSDKCELGFLAEACDSHCPSGASCISAYNKMRKEKKFKDAFFLITELNTMTKLKNQIRKLKSEKQSDATDKLIAEKESRLNALTAKLKGHSYKSLNEKLDVMFLAEGNANDGECIPQVAKNTLKYFEKVRTLERELNTCQAQAEAPEKVPKAPAGYSFEGDSLDHQLKNSDPKSAK